MRAALCGNPLRAVERVAEYPVSVASKPISSYFRPTLAGVAVMTREGLNTSCHCPCQKSRQRQCRRKPLPQAQGGRQAATASAGSASGCCGAKGLFHPGGGVCLRSFAMDSSRRRVRQRIRAGFHRCGRGLRSNRRKPGDHLRAWRKKGTTDLSLRALQVGLGVVCWPFQSEDSVCSAV